LAKSTDLDSVRCSLLNGKTLEEYNVRGNILEIGPGPGTNFRCLENTTTDRINKWVGVEPNKYFNQYLEEEKVKRNISFPTEVVWLKGEDIDIEPSSFDAVIATHVLCSVENINSIFNQVHRALKNNGTYYFIGKIIYHKNISIIHYDYF